MLSSIIQLVMNSFKFLRSLKALINPSTTSQNLHKIVIYTNQPIKIPIHIVPTSWAPSCPRILYKIGDGKFSSEKVIKMKKEKWLKDFSFLNNHSLTCLRLFRWRKSERQWRCLENGDILSESFDTIQRNAFVNCWKIDVCHLGIFPQTSFNITILRHIIHTREGMYVYENERWIFEVNH